MHVLFFTKVLVLLFMCEMTTTGRVTYDLCYLNKLDTTGAVRDESNSAQTDTVKQKIMKRLQVLLVNDATHLQGSECISRTKKIFLEAQKIFERSKWKRAKVSLALSGVTTLLEQGLKSKMHGVMHRSGVHENRSPVVASTFTEYLSNFEAMMNKVKFNPMNLDSELYRAGLILLLTTSDNYAVGGFTYIGGADTLKNYSIVNLSVYDADSYSGKLLAHEVAHSLGATHDEDPGYLMEESIGPKACGLSEKSVKEIENFFLCNNMKKEYAAEDIL